MKLIINVITSSEFLEKHVSNKASGILYYMWMLPSKVMPYLLRLAAPLTDSSIVHGPGMMFRFVFLQL